MRKIITTQICSVKQICGVYYFFISVILKFYVRQMFFTNIQITRTAARKLTPNNTSFTRPEDVNIRIPKYFFAGKKILSPFLLKKSKNKCVANPTAKYPAAIGRKSHRHPVRSTIASNECIKVRCLGSLTVE